MNGRHSVVILFVAVAFAAGSFVVTSAWQPPAATGPSDTEMPCSTMPGCGAGCCKSLASWLGLGSQQVCQVERIMKEYNDKRLELETALFAERQKLAELFDRDSTTDKEILEQVERVIEADSSLERLVVAHLVSLRPHLSGKQRTRLFRRCAEGVRDAGGCQWRHAGQGRPGCGGADEKQEQLPTPSCGSQPTGCSSHGPDRDAGSGNHVCG